MDKLDFGSTGLRVSPIGLGCSRLGSILGASRDTAVELLELALESGVTYFDTSDLYGQGESERLLGRHIAGRPTVIVATKIGKRHPMKMRLLTPFKHAFAGLLRSSASASNIIRQARAKPIPSCFQPSYLSRAIDRGLVRLNCTTVDVIMLHSPAAEVLMNGDAVGVLERAKTQGKLRVIGVSVDDLGSAETALADSRIQALQVPLRFEDKSFHAVVAKAAQQGVAVVAREIFGSVSRERRNMPGIVEAVRSSLAVPGVSVSLVGTIHSDHLAQAIQAIAR